MSGNAKSTADCDNIVDVLEEYYEQIDVVNIDKDNNIRIADEIQGYDALAACGGDGTLNSALNAIKNTKTELIYIPSGTLNDTAKSLHLAKELSKGNRRIRRIDIGKVNDSMFAYVCAGGTFTPIGYKTKTKHKKHFKALAYIFMVLKEYKVHHIKAKILSGNKAYEGDYTLIMAVNSERCFGFDFNHLYCHNDGKGQLLLIKAPKGKGIFAKISLFFPFFRAFFIGFKKELSTKNIEFFSFSEAKLLMDKPYTFTVDGEEKELAEKNDIKILRQKLKLIVY